jgi:hypothetical protein
LHSNRPAAKTAKFFQHLFTGASSKMTIQRITNLHSAPISACLRAFVLAAEVGILKNSRPCSRPSASTASTANVGQTLGMNVANMFKGGNAYVTGATGITQGNSATLRGSA